MTSILEKSIETHDINLIKKLLKDGITPNGDIDYSLLEYAWDDYSESSSLEILILLLKYGANPDFGYKPYTEGTILMSACINDIDNAVILFLEYGANPCVITEELSTPLFESLLNNNYFNTCALLKYGAKVVINRYHSLSVMTALEQAIKHCGFNMIKLLLDNGADTTIQTEFNELILSLLNNNSNSSTATYTQEEYEKLKTLLNPNNPPYLKLGESEEDKYIIYENKKTDDENYEIYLLTDKQKHKDKKYLYADNKSDAFVYWCYKHELLIDPIMKLIEKYLSRFDTLEYKNFSNLIKEVMTGRLTTDYFSKDGKEFATAYLTVTHWWYNLHTDFNRLYQDDNTRLPRAIKSQEEFDTLMKLLDIRYTQFQSGKDFNSNQNKEELEALIEGREPPKRVVDLSFLEKEVKDDVSSNDNDTIPDDFMK